MRAPRPPNSPPIFLRRADSVHIPAVGIGTFRHLRNAMERKPSGPFPLRQSQPSFREICDGKPVAQVLVHKIADPSRRSLSRRATGFLLCDYCAIFRDPVPRLGRRCFPEPSSRREDRCRPPCCSSDGTCPCGLLSRSHHCGNCMIGLLFRVHRCGRPHCGVSLSAVAASCAAVVSATCW